MPDALAFQALEADDLLEIDRQESQVLWLGMPGEIQREQAEILASQPCAWTAWSAGRIVACFGIAETFPGKQGVAWALLSKQLGVHHLPLTRFMRSEVRECGLARLELLAKASEDVEDYCDLCREDNLPCDTGVLVRVAMCNATPECRFAVLLGFEAAHVLRRFGGASETYMLFERFDPSDDEEID